MTAPHNMQMWPSLTPGLEVGNGFKLANKKRSFEELADVSAAFEGVKKTKNQQHNSLFMGLDNMYMFPNINQYIMPTLQQQMPSIDMLKTQLLDAHLAHLNQQNTLNRQIQLQQTDQLFQKLQFTNIQVPPVDTQTKKRSAFRGVIWDKNSRAWRAKLSVKGKLVHVGLFEDEKEAAIAWDKKAIEVRGHNTRLNFPELVKDLSTIELKSKRIRKKVTQSESE